MDPARGTARPGSAPTTPPTRRGPTHRARHPSGSGIEPAPPSLAGSRVAPIRSGLTLPGRAPLARGRARNRPSSVPDPAAHAVDGFHRVDLAEMLAAIRALARPHSAPLSWGPRLCVSGASEGPGAPGQALLPKCARIQASPRRSPPARVDRSAPRCPMWLGNLLAEAGRPSGARGRGAVGSGGCHNGSRTDAANIDSDLR